MSQVDAMVCNQWSLVCQEIVRKQWKLRKHVPNLKECWEIVCHDVEAFKWNTRTCALWNLVKIEFLLFDVWKDLYLLNSPGSSLNSPIQATTD